MKILVIEDIHGHEKEIDKILRKDFTDIDVIICAGDITDMYNIPEGFTQMDMAELIIQKITALKKPVLSIPGNHDPYEILNLFEDYGINLHNKQKKIGNITFIGFGGASTPFNTLFEPTEKEIEKSLSRFSPKEDFVLVVHQPPKNTKQDRVESGQHVGSEAVRNFIIKKKPVLAVSGHIHEATGTDKLGNTILFNPGPAYEGRYGVIEIKEKKLKCEIITV